LDWPLARPEPRNLNRSWVLAAICPPAIAGTRCLPWPPATSCCCPGSAPARLFPRYIVLLHVLKYVAVGVITAVRPSSGRSVGGGSAAPQLRVLSPRGGSGNPPGRRGGLLNALPVAEVQAVSSAADRCPTAQNRAAAKSGVGAVTRSCLLQIAGLGIRTAAVKPESLRVRRRSARTETRTS